MKKVIGVVRSRGNSGEHRAALLIEKKLKGKTLICAPSSSMYSFMGVSEIDYDSITSTHDADLCFVTAGWTSTCDKFHKSEFDNLILCAARGGGNHNYNAATALTLCDEVYISVNNENIYNALDIAKISKDFKFIIWSKIVECGEYIHSSDTLSSSEFISSSDDIMLAASEYISSVERDS